MRTWNYRFDVPDAKKVRMIVHTDCKNEADDQFALAHHLMTPKFLVKGIIGAHFNANINQISPEAEGHTAQMSVEEIHRVLTKMDVEGIAPVFHGAELPLEDEYTPRITEAAEFIVAEAMREDPHPLFIACQGSLTDLASAILLEPAICDRMTAIWIGGGMYPEGGFEFNLMQDIAAANVLMKSRMPVWQVPIMTYKQMTVSLAEVQLGVSGCGEIGDYLLEQMNEVNRRTAHIPHWPNGESWSLGDSPTVGLLLCEEEKTDMYEEWEAPRILPDMSYAFDGQNRKIRVYKDVNVRLTIADFFAKLRINYGER